MIKNNKKKIKIDIWLAQNIQINNTQLWRYLPINERKKANSLIRAEKINRYIVSRSMIRIALSNASKGKVPPNRWIIKTREKGKPWAFDPKSKRSIQFNLSHAQDISVVAVSVHHEVGIDIEPLNQDIKVSDLWAVLTKSEKTNLTLTSPRKKTMELLRIWTLKEAYLKLIGTGLSIDPASIQIDYTTSKIISNIGLGLQTNSSFFLKNWIIELDHEPFSISLATWKTNLAKPAITFKFFNQYLDKHYSFSILRKMPITKRRNGHGEIASLV